MVQLTSITTINLIIMKHFYTVLPPPPLHPRPPPYHDHFHLFRIYIMCNPLKG